MVGSDLGRQEKLQTLMGPIEIAATSSHAKRLVHEMETLRISVLHF
jgi:hypothetical protein